MVEKEVNEEVLTADFEVMLAADEREADTEFEEEFADVSEQGAFEISLMRFLAQTKEVKHIRVFEEALRKFGLG